MHLLNKFATLSAAGEAVRRGELKCSDMIAALLQRIDERDADIHAWVNVDGDSALRQAEQIDVQAQHGSPGPLHGLTVGVKDIIDVAGFPTLAASPLRDCAPVERDAPIVRQLRDAGAIILGKTVTTQWAFLDPPPTANPHNLQRTPGGSSSGSAAAVAAQMCHVALGTQTGGSVIRPAAFCGAFGFMFAPGVVSSEGILPLAPSLDRPGLIAGSLNDLQRAYCVLSGVASEWLQQHTMETQQVKVLRAPWIAQADADVRRVFDQAIANLPRRAADLGIKTEVIDCDLSREFQGVAAAHRCVMAYEAAQVHREAFARASQQFAPKIGQLIRTGLQTEEREYNEALARLRAWQAAINAETANGCLLVMPAAPTPAPPRETTGDPSFNSPWTAAGTPVLTAPIGESHDALPIGIQLIAAPGEEPRLFKIAGM